MKKYISTYLGNQFQQMKKKKQIDFHTYTKILWEFNMTN